MSAQESECAQVVRGRRSTSNIDMATLMKRSTEVEEAFSQAMAA